MNLRKAVLLFGHLRDVFRGDDMQVIKRRLGDLHVGGQGGND